MYVFNVILYNLSDRRVFPNNIDLCIIINDFHSSLVGGLLLFLFEIFVLNKSNIIINLFESDIVIIISLLSLFSY